MWRIYRSQISILLIAESEKIRRPLVSSFLIRDIADIFALADGIDTEIIAASVRHPMHVTECALAGADIATVPYKVIEQMVNHPLTTAGIEKFRVDYEDVFDK